MADFRQRAEAEFENIEKALSKLPAIAKIATLSDLELAGIAFIIHSLYNGIE